MSNNYLNFCQIFTDNFLVDRVSRISLGGANTWNSNIPISYKFGGDAFSLDNRFNLPAQENAKVATEDLGFEGGLMYIFDIDLGTAPKRVTNFMFRTEDDATITTVMLPDNAKAVLEAYRTDLPVSRDSEANKPDDTYFMRRISQEYWYVNLPRNLSYRYFRVKIYRTGQNDIRRAIRIVLKDLFLGDSVDIDRAPSRGISHKMTDESTEFIAESGRSYFLERQKRQTIGNVEFPLLKAWQVSALKIWSDRVGIVCPFWVALDPHGVWDAPRYGMSIGVYRLTEMPTFQHEVADYWSCTLSLTEAI